MFQQLIPKGKSLLLVGLLLASRSLALCATTVYLHDTASPLGTSARSGAGVNCANGSHTYRFRLANSTAGTIGSPTNFSFIPATNNVPCLAQTATTNGEFARFASPPLSGSVTISGSINLQIGCGQSSSNLNSGRSVNIYRWTPARGITAAVFAWPSKTSSTPECTGTTPTHRTVTITPTATLTFGVGDRIIVDLLVSQGSGNASLGANGTRTALTCWGGTAASKCRTYVQFAETFTFAADKAESAPRVRSD
jgi:hypothetical protein